MSVLLVFLAMAVILAGMWAIVTGCRNEHRSRVRAGGRSRHLLERPGGRGSNDGSDLVAEIEAWLKQER